MQLEVSHEGVKFPMQISLTFTLVRTWFSLYMAVSSEEARKAVPPQTIAWDKIVVQK